ncbi:hypothetical protein OSB04_013770 [Centaurea solstitialis]|uniref:Uncharacterized protein n=1 Tax=Centaurea solstitialis TaxID=347529 RepID=A0AA38TRT9_9ASTR|nr:hypothetical protein OSB04_013770 [Centaurea solstitialis]
MAFRSKEMVKKIMKKIGGEKNLESGVKESLKKCLPESKVVMGRAHRGIFAGRHIQFGNNDSEELETQRTGQATLQLRSRPPHSRKSNNTRSPLYRQSRRDRRIPAKDTVQEDGHRDGLLWKAKIEKMYQELGNMEVSFFPQEEETKLAEEFKEMRIEQRIARRDARRMAYGWSPKPEQIEDGSEDVEGTHNEELVVNS